MFTGLNEKIQTIAASMSSWFEPLLNTLVQFDQATLQVFAGLNEKIQTYVVTWVTDFAATLKAQIRSVVGPLWDWIVGKSGNQNTPESLANFGKSGLAETSQKFGYEAPPSTRSLAGLGQSGLAATSLTGTALDMDRHRAVGVELQTGGFFTPTSRPAPIPTLEGGSLPLPESAQRGFLSGRAPGRAERPGGLERQAKGEVRVVFDNAPPGTRVSTEREESLSIETEVGYNYGALAGVGTSGP